MMHHAAPNSAKTFKQRQHLKPTILVTDQHMIVKATLFQGGKIDWHSKESPSYN